MYATQDFDREQYGTAFKVNVTLALVNGRPALQLWLHWHTGYGGGSRRADTRHIDTDAALVVRMGCERTLPREVLADQLQELGYDEGFTATVRG